MCLICLSAFTTKANCERHLKVHTDTLSGRWAVRVGEYIHLGPRALTATHVPQVSVTAVASSLPLGTSSTATW